MKRVLTLALTVIMVFSLSVTAFGKCHHKKAVEKTAPTELAAPVVKQTAKVTGKAITISWSKTADATGYYVYRATSGSEFTKVAKVKGKNSTSYTNKKVSGTYQYKVVAYFANKTVTVVSPDSNVITATTLNLPVMNKVVKNADGTNTLSWKASTGATQYYVYQKVKKHGKWTKVATVTDTTYTTPVVTEGVLYSYKVRAVKVTDSTTSITKSFSCTKTAMHKKHHR